MKKKTSKEIVRLQRYIKKTGKQWKEGLSYTMADIVISTLKPRYYWIEGDSYIFHEQKTPIYYCISKSYVDKV